MVENLCCSCVFARWDKTANGRLHPSGHGMCSWETRIALPYSAPLVLPFMMPVFEIARTGGSIYRKSSEPVTCAVYQKIDD